MLSAAGPAQHGTMFNVRRLVAVAVALACTSCTFEVRHSEASRPVASAGVLAGQPDPPFMIDPAELPGAWKLTREVRPSDAELNEPGRSCGEPVSGDDLQHGWHGTFQLESIEDGAFNSAFLSVSSGHWLHTEGPDVEVAGFEQVGLADCIGRLRTADYQLAPDTAQTTVRRALDGLPGIGPESGVRAAWFRTQLAADSPMGPLVVDTVYLVTDEARARIVASGGTADGLLLLHTVLPIVSARLQGAPARSLVGVSTVQPTTPPVDRLPGSTDELRLTRADVERFVNAAPPGSSLDGCPTVAGPDLRAAAPGLWARWQTQFVEAGPVFDAGGSEAGDPVMALVCRWKRTAVVDDDLWVTVMAADNTFATDAATEAGNHGYQAGNSTWGPSWCNVRDEEHVMIRIFSGHSAISTAEMWALCDAAVPQIRRAVLAG